MGGNIAEDAFKCFRRLPMLACWRRCSQSARKQFLGQNKGGKCPVLVKYREPSDVLRVLGSYYGPDWHFRLSKVKTAVQFYDSLICNRQNRIPVIDTAPPIGLVFQLNNFECMSSLLSQQHASPVSCSTALSPSRSRGNLWRPLAL